MITAVSNVYMFVVNSQEYAFGIVYGSNCVYILSCCSEFVYFVSANIQVMYKYPSLSTAMSHGAVMFPCLIVCEKDRSTLGHDYFHGLLPVVGHDHLLTNRIPADCYHGYCYQLIAHRHHQLLVSVVYMFVCY